MADGRIQQLLREIEPALVELRTRYGVSLAEGGCPGGCQPEDRVTWEGYPQLIAGDLWQVRGCSRCLRAEPVRHRADRPLPAAPLLPHGALWLPLRIGSMHRVHLTAPDMFPASTLRSGCGWPFDWPEAPVLAIRFAHGPLLGSRCGLCERAVRRAVDCDRDAPLIWDELLCQARAAIAAGGHRDPWERVGGTE